MLGPVVVEIGISAVTTRSITAHRDACLSSASMTASGPMATTRFGSDMVC
jgi:hypothetical protein